MASDGTDAEEKIGWSRSGSPRSIGAVATIHWLERGQLPAFYAFPIAIQMLVFTISRRRARPALPAARALRRLRTP